MKMGYLNGKEVVPFDLTDDTAANVKIYKENKTWAAVAVTKMHARLPILETIRISTVFLGLNHSWDEGKDSWFETMIFGSPKDQEYQERYETWEQAEVGHRRAFDYAYSEIPSHMRIFYRVEHLNKEQLNEIETKRKG